jgi:ribosomal-protein-alanine N-acetyltransferase
VTRQKPTVRTLEPSDIEAAAGLHHLAFGWESWDAKSLGEILNMPCAAGLIAQVFDGYRATVLGFLLYLLVAEDVEILTIAVHPDRRREGIATLLMESCMSLAAASGARDVILEVAEDNPGAQRFYDRLGFQIEGRRKNYYVRPGNERIAASLLRRPIRRA